MDFDDNNPYDNPYGIDINELMRKLSEQLKDFNGLNPQEILAKIQEQMRNMGLEGHLFDPTKFSDTFDPNAPLPSGVFSFKITQDADGEPKIDMNFSNVQNIGDMEAILHQHDSNKENPVEVEELDYPDRRVIIADLPGVEEENLELIIKDKNLEIFALTKDYEFSKSVALNGAIEYSYRLVNGVLEISIPK